MSALVARLDPSESQTPEDEMLNAFVIDDLVDLNAVEAAPTIRRAIDEDRVDTSIVDLDHVFETLDLPRALRPARVKATGGLRLRLHCTACGYEREHQIETIYCDLGTMDRRDKGEPTPFSEYVIPHRITCPKCGAVDQYRLSNLAYMTLMAEMLKIQAAHELGKPEDETDDGPLRFIRFALADGREMHPFAARDMYRQQVETEPNRPELRVRYANVLRFLDYHKEAVEQYRAALSLDPSNLEAYLNLGQLAQTVGNRLEARQMFESLIEHAPMSRLPLKERQDCVAEATAELVALSGRAIQVSAPKRQVQPKRWETAPGRVPGIAPSRSLAPGAHKVGRNDPCPCGSGKKYKKCHGR